LAQTQARAILRGRRDNTQRLRRTKESAMTRHLRLQTCTLLVCTLLVCGVLVSACGAASPSPTPADTATPTAVTLPVTPAAATTPTAGASRPAETPASSEAERIPLPAFDANLTLAPAELDYLQAVALLLNGHQQAIDAVADRFAAATADSAVISEEVWRLETTVTLAAVRDTNGRLRALTPPTRFASLHDSLLNMSEELDLAAAALASARESQAAGALEAGVAPLASARSVLADVRATVEGLQR
jgi:hypothetical protein